MIKGWDKIAYTYGGMMALFIVETLLGGHPREAFALFLASTIAEVNCLLNWRMSNLIGKVEKKHPDWKL